ncbi:hypothetical protein MIR68_001926 [Amoeboaphelidium protococcarum]|nr:hypothetical protein MIR68_001926 [Amoeboaphelidium protococcarum]
MTTPTKDSLLQLLRHKKLEITVKELEEGIITFDEILSLTEKQCTDLYGLQGIFIYNHLHPSLQAAALTTSVKLMNEGELASSYNHYMKIGEALIKDPMVVRVRDELLSLIAAESRSSSTPHPFLFVLDSSGTGKTQLAFALKSALSRCKITTMYLVCSPVGDSSQPIYRVYADISHAFQECVRRDLLGIRTVDELSCTSLARKSLYIFGLIAQLLIDNDKEPPTVVNYEQKTAQQVWSKLDNCLNYPVVILDEFSTREGDNDNTLRLLRNSIRALKFGLVLLGTNSTAVNLIDKSIEWQSRDMDSFHWCSLYYSLPKVRISALELPLKCDDWIRGLLCSSRPLFAVIARDCLRNYKDGSGNGMSQEDIDGWFRDIALRIISQKKIFDNPFGRHGQVCLFLNMNYDYTNNVITHNYPLIHRHFAHLEERVVGWGDKFCIRLLKDMTLDSDERTKWNPRITFPTPEDDVLLFLCLMGTLKSNPFRDGSGQDISLRQAVQEIERSRRSNELKLMYDNAIQISNDGMFLEAILASSLCVASHSNGIGGICLRDFICSVYAHIQNQELLYIYSLKMPEDASALVDLLENFIIPNLAPPNQKWPQCVQAIPNSRFGHLYRTKNQTRLDLDTDFQLTGESKDYNGPIDISTMRSMIERVPTSSKVHFIFVRRLQSKYFTRSSFSTEFPSKNICFCVVKACKSDLLLAKIDGLPDIHSFNSNSTLVIFYPINK